MSRACVTSRHVAIFIVQARSHVWNEPDISLQIQFPTQSVCNHILLKLLYSCCFQSLQGCYFNQFLGLFGLHLITFAQTKFTFGWILSTNSPDKILLHFQIHLYCEVNNLDVVKIPPNSIWSHFYRKNPHFVCS